MKQLDLTDMKWYQSKSHHNFSSKRLTPYFRRTKRNKLSQTSLAIPMRFSEKRPYSVVYTVGENHKIRSSFKAFKFDPLERCSAIRYILASAIIIHLDLIFEMILLENYRFTWKFDTAAGRRAARNIFACPREGLRWTQRVAAFFRWPEPALYFKSTLM